MHSPDPKPDFAAELTSFEWGFTDALLAEGYGEHQIPADGQWHDFAFPDSKNRKKNGAAKLTFGGDGVVIDRRKGKKAIFTWPPEGGVTPLTDEQREELQRHNEARDAELKQRREAARLKAANGLPQMPEATPDHPYLKKKGITDPRPLKLDNTNQLNRLVIPIYTALTGELQTLQTISPAGWKKFLKDGVSKGGCLMPGSHGLDDLKLNDDPLVIAEGYATAEAIRRATGWPTLAAMDCGNMQMVAEVMRQRFPKRQIILAADNDTSKIGFETATRAAQAVDGKVAMPTQIGSDFSGLLLAEGLQAVESIIKNAATPIAQEDEPPSSNAARVIVRNRPGKEFETENRVEEILLASSAEIYQRGGMLVRPIIAETDASHGQKTKVVRLKQVTPAFLNLELCKLIQWERFDGRSKKWVPARAPPEVTADILSQEGRWKFPVVTGVISTPTIRPDGSLLLTPGYDAATRLLLVAPPPMPVIPDRPTRDDALAALQLLEDDLLEEFPFVDDVSKSVALSAVITPIARGAFPVTPMHILRAPTSGSGKSYFLDTVSMIAIGQKMPVIAAGRNEEETEKRLGSALLTGQPLISIDNVNGELGGDALCQMVERPIVQVRILAKSELVTIESRGTSMFATGNNIVIVSDLVRRVEVATLDAGVEKPEDREFRKDPVKMILEDRGKYIAACLTICRAYIVAGYPNKAKPLPSFERWSDVVRSSLMWLGKADPVQSINTIRDDDPERNQLLSVMTAWSKEFGIGKDFDKAVNEVIKEAEETAGGYNGFLFPELRDAIQAVASKKGKLEAGILTYWLRKSKGRVVDGLRFANKPSHGNTKRWWVEHIDGKPAEDRYRQAMQKAEESARQAEEEANDNRARKGM